jgi:pilus assembly protein Flp/PilA
MRVAEGRAEETSMNFITRLRAFAKNEEAQDLIEYALLVGLISLVAVAAITAAGGSINTIFTNIGAKLAAAA